VCDFSIIQSRGETGNLPGNETGLGASAYLRAAFARSFFVEGMSAAVSRLSSYEPLKLPRSPGQVVKPYATFFFL
jgi:hypothetical protein